MLPIHNTPSGVTSVDDGPLTNACTLCGRRTRAWKSTPQPGAVGALATVVTALAVLAGTGRVQPAAAQQLGDTTLAPVVESPAFPMGDGPRVALDEAHFNFHTLDGRYAPFARLLRADGFVVEPMRGPFSEESLSDVDLLVIANALHPRNEQDWSLPNPSAFTPDEVAAVREWVEGGGALLLIADHMPFPGAAASIAAS